MLVMMLCVVTHVHAADDGQIWRDRELYHAVRDNEPLARIKALVKRGARVEAMQKLYAGDDSALHYAAKGPRIELVHYLIEECLVNVNVKNDFGATPCHWAAEEDRDEAIYVLYQNCADVNAKNDAGDTPLHCACSFGSVHAVAALCAIGANVNAKNYAGYTPLHAACLSGSLDAVQALLAYRANTQETNNAGRTPAEIAQRKNHKAVVKFIEEYGKHS